MDKKTVTEAVSSQIRKQGSDEVRRALDLLINKNGVFRTDEKWVHTALRPLIDRGYVNRDGATLTIGRDFESLLISLADADPGTSKLLSGYRKFVSSKVAEYDVTEFTVLEKMSSIPTTDEKIIYLTSVLADTFAKLDVALEKTAFLEGKLAEMDISLSVMESVTFDEDSDS